MRAEVPANPRSLTAWTVRAGDLVAPARTIRGRGNLDEQGGPGFDKDRKRISPKHRRRDASREILSHGGGCSGEPPRAVQRDWNLERVIVGAGELLLKARPRPAREGSSEISRRLPVVLR